MDSHLFISSNSVAYPLQNPLWFTIFVSPCGSQLQRVFDPLPGPRDITTPISNHREFFCASNDIKRKKIEGPRGRQIGPRRQNQEEIRPWPLRLKVAWIVEKDDAILVLKSILGFKGSKPQKINLKLSRTPPAAPADVICDKFYRCVVFLFVM